MEYNLDLNKLSTYVFKPEINILFSNGEIFNATDFFYKFDMNFNPFKNIFPYFKLVLSLNLEDIVRIQKDNNATVTISIKKKADTDEIGYYDYYMEKKEFKIILNEKTPVDYGETSLITTSDKKHQNVFKNYTMVLLPKELMENNKKVVSGIYKDCTVLDVLISLINKLNIKNYEIIQPDNRIKYNQIILLPNTILSNLRHINDNYGIYMTGSTICSTLDKFLIVPKDQRRYKTKDNRNIVNVNFNSSAKNEKATKIGCYKDGNTKFFNTNLNNIYIKDNSKLFEELLGNNLTFFYEDEKDNYNYRELELMDINKSTTTKTKVYKNTFNNIQKEHELFKNIDENKILYFNFTNLDIDLNDVNQMFQFLFDNGHYGNIYNGEYLLENIKISFTTDSVGYANIKGLGILKKLEK